MEKEKMTPQQAFEELRQVMANLVQQLGGSFQDISVTPSSEMSDEDRSILELLVDKQKSGVLRAVVFIENDMGVRQMVRISS